MNEISKRNPYNDIGGITTIFLVGTAIVFLISIKFPTGGTILNFVLWFVLIGIIDGNFTEIRSYVKKLEKRLAEFEEKDAN